MLPTVLRYWYCFIWLCGFYHGAFDVESLSSHAFPALFSIVITSHGKDSAGLYASRAFVC